MTKMKKALSVLLLLLVLSHLACSHPTERTPGQPVPHSIVIYGDCRSGHDTHRQIVADAVSIRPDAVFCVGDLVDDGSSADQWANFDNITSELREVAPYYPALGNHDLPPELFFERFDLPNNERWYSVDVKGLHFVVLDTTIEADITEGSEQHAWLESQLQEVGEEFVAVLTHHPLLSTGNHGGDPDLDRVLTPLFEEYGVDIVFSGHDHDYERSLRNGIYYIVTGGGGAPLYGRATKNPYSEVFHESHQFCTLFMSNDTVTVEAFDLDGNIIDEFSFGIA